MDVMRTGCSMLGTLLPEATITTLPGARDIADRLMASFGSMLLYWYHLQPQRQAHRTSRPTTTRSAATSCTCCTARSPRVDLGARDAHLADPLRRARVQRLDVHRARVAGTGSDMYSAITGGIGALRGPKHGGANEVAFDIHRPLRQPGRGRGRHRRASNKEIVIGFGHPVYTIADPRNKVIKEVAQRLSKEGGNMKLFDIADRLER
jgi:2-methylcitrate synthase